MVLITFNKCQRLLCLNYVQRVSSAELAAVRDDLKAALADLPDGFRLLVDLSQVEFMDPDCLPDLGRAMELFDQRGVSLIVRVIPDASKDIGLNILTLFHYPHHPRVITCQNLAEALRQLAVWK
jgi:anti-anti-sigma regulatory factor